MTNSPPNPIKKAQKAKMEVKNTLVLLFYTSKFTSSISDNSPEFSVHFTKRIRPNGEELPETW
jgi:hypothetical protein